ncbi:MAG: hypothetical protein OZSIB_0466 [Candidatus Ozemobacter sibiricus]|uniref:SbsA Ig-like domain-containing protein n=1 Tax=Candidatus Ozemobacter sibiricus TaxID=2268124 RepID=A0A367ZLD7_9BACT|nr:MAG: hypothetical protein OZSIB_0466 [Candidatus Ozemobacter sibiricus]
MSAKNTNSRVPARTDRSRFWAALAVLVTAVVVTLTGCNPLGSGGGAGDDVVPVPAFTDSGYYVTGKLMLPRVEFDETSASVREAEGALRMEIQATDEMPAAGYVVFLPKFPEIFAIVASDGTYRLGPVPPEAEEDFSDLYGDENGFDLWGETPEGQNTGSVKATQRLYGRAAAGQAPRGYLAPILDQLREIEKRTGQKVLDKIPLPVVKPSIKIIGVPPEAFGDPKSLSTATIKAALRAGFGDWLVEAATAMVKEIPGPKQVVETVENVVQAFKGNFSGDLDLGLPSLNQNDLMAKLGDSFLVPITMQPNNRVARGKITNENGVGLPAAVLRLNGATFLTTLSGEFETPKQPRGSKSQIEIVGGPYAQKLPPIDFSFPSDQKPYYNYQVFPNDWANNKPPVVSLAADRYTVGPNGVVTLTARATDPENQGLRFAWSASRGTIKGNNLSATFSPGQEAGVATITFEATDPANNKGRTSINIFVTESIGPFSAPDNSIPVIMPDTGLSPAPQAANVSGIAPLVITFNRPVAAAGANLFITIFDEEANAEVERISPTDTGKVVVNGNVVTIKPRALRPGRKHSVTIAAGAFRSADFLKSFAGITARTTWTFTTAQVFASLEPVPTKGIAVGADLVAVFDRDVIKGSGNILIRKVSGDDILATIPVTDARVTLTGGRTLRIAHDPFVPGTALYVQIPETAIVLPDGKPFFGVTGSWWNFTVNTAPNVDRVAFTSTTQATYYPGQTISFIVNFSGPVQVTGNPAVALNTTPARQALYVNSPAPDQMAFSYTVQPGDFVDRLDYASVNALTTNGGSIKAADGADALLPLPTPGGTGSLAADRAVKIELVPAVTLVTSSAPNGSYVAGDVIPIQVTFSKTVNVTGAPQLELNTGDVKRKAVYASGGGTTVLVFNYTVQAGDSSSDLDYTGPTALTLNGGTIKGAAGEDALLTLPAIGSVESLGVQKNLVIGDAAPGVTLVSSTQANGTYDVGAVIPIQITFSKVVKVTGTPQLELNTGSVKQKADYTSGDGSNVLVFTYTVQPGDTSADLDYTSVNALALNGGTIKGTGDEIAVLTLPGVGTANSLGGQKNLVINTQPPAVTLVSSTKANGTYDVGTEIAIQVTFSKAVKVTGTPQLELDTGSVKRKASYDSGDGTTVLTFLYQVQAGDTSADLNYPSVDALTLNGGTIKSDTGADAVLTLPAITSANSLGGQKNLVIDTQPPAVTLVSSTKANGTYDVGTEIAIQVTFSKPVKVTGTPQLELDTGSVKQKANYTSGDGSNVLVFTYTVQAGDTSSDLNYTSTNALSLNGGTIKSDTGADAVLTLPAITSANSLGGQKNLVIDTAPPTFLTTAPTSPLPGATDVNTTTLIMSFSSAIEAMGGTISIKKYSDNSLIESFAANNTAKVTVSGSQATLKINALAGGTKVYVVMGNDCFRKQSGGTAFPGISSKDTWSFTTAATGAINGFFGESIQNVGLPGVKIEVRAGSDNTTGDVLVTGTVGAGGAFAFSSLPVGPCTLLFTDPSIYPVHHNVTVVADTDTNIPEVRTVKVVPANTFKVYLRCNSNDYYIVGTFPKDDTGGRYQCGGGFYPSSAGDAEAKMDHSSFSTTEELNVTSHTRAGLYRFFVKDGGFLGLNFSDVRVTLYLPGGEMREFKPTGTPTAGNTVWVAFEMSEDGGVNPINTFQAVAPE